MRDGTTWIRSSTTRWPVYVYQAPLPFEKLVGDLSGAYSRRISIQHRLVYQVLDDARTVKVLRMWTHYE